MIHTIHQSFVSIFLNHRRQNLKRQDGAKCVSCGVTIPILTNKHVITGGKYKGQVHEYVDRSNRVDCDLSEGTQGQRVKSYHVECWRKLLYR